MRTRDRVKNHRALFGGEVRSEYLPDSPVAIIDAADFTGEHSRVYLSPAQLRRLAKRFEWIAEQIETGL